MGSGKERARATKAGRSGGRGEAPTATRCSSGVRMAMAGLLLLLDHERENEVRRGRESGGAARREGGRRSLAAGGTLRRRELRRSAGARETRRGGGARDRSWLREERERRSSSGWPGGSRGGLGCQLVRREDREGSQGGRLDRVAAAGTKWMDGTRSLVSRVAHYLYR